MSIKKVDFDLYSIGDFVLGSVVDINSNRIENKEGGYSIYFQNKTVDGFFICLNSGYRGYDKFEGELIKNGRKINISNESEPNEILLLFGDPVDKWDDGSEINIQFLDQDKYNIEFSWGVKKNDTMLDYIIAELL